MVQQNLVSPWFIYSWLLLALLGKRKIFVVHVQQRKPRMTSVHNVCYCVPTGRDRVRDRSWREERGRAEGRGQASRRSEGILSRESMEENGERGERRQSETFVEDPQEVPRAGYYFEVRSTAINRHRVLYLSLQIQFCSSK